MTENLRQSLYVNGYFNHDLISIPQNLFLTFYFISFFQKVRFLNLGVIFFLKNCLTLLDFDRPQK